MSPVALVTGAARGIGAATARSLASEGWTVVGLDRAGDDARFGYAMGSTAELDALAAEGIDVAQVDVSRESEIERAVAGVRERHGGLDVVVAAAGVIGGGVPLWELPRGQVDAILSVNLHAVVATARATIPVLLERAVPRQGRFIAVASAAATRGLPMLSAYCASKAGVTGLVRGLALELRGTGVTVNAVSPGSTRTAMLDESARLYGLPSAAAFAGQQPLERLLEPDEVAAMIVWLAGPAGAAVTGADVAVDGGLAV